MFSAVLLVVLYLSNSQFTLPLLSGGEEDRTGTVQCGLPSQESCQWTDRCTQENTGQEWTHCIGRPSTVQQCNVGLVVDINFHLCLQIFEMVDAKARQDCIKEIDLLKVCANLVPSHETLPTVFVSNSYQKTTLHFSLRPSCSLPSSFSATPPPSPLLSSSLYPALLLPLPCSHPLPLSPSPLPSPSSTHMCTHSN